MFTALLALSVLGGDPVKEADAQFAKSVGMRYAEAYLLTEAGIKLTVFIPDHPFGADTYQTYLKDGEPCSKSTTRKEPVAQEVRPTPTFHERGSNPVAQQGLRAGGVTAFANPVVTGSRSHNCPACGSGPWTTILGFNPNGTHSHQCGRCGTVFSH